MSDLSDADLLAAFDTQVRRPGDNPAGFRAERLETPAPMLLIRPADDTASWGGGVFWCDLDETNADEAIATAIDRFRPAGREFEWKHYSYDTPADLPDRLRVAGLEPQDEEALVVGEVRVVCDRLAAAPEPAGITIRRVRPETEDPAAWASDWQGIGDLHAAVWGGDGTAANASVASSMTEDPDGTSVWVAVAEDGAIVCAARANFHAGTEFVSLWGGSTLPGYRGLGIYQALVSRRADEAAERGFRYLQIDASPDSRPILQRLGLRVLATTTPWTWKP